MNVYDITTDYYWSKMAGAPYIETTQFQNLINFGVNFADWTALAEFGVEFTKSTTQKNYSNGTHIQLTCIAYIINHTFKKKKAKIEPTFRAATPSFPAAPVSAAPDVATAPLPPLPLVVVAVVSVGAVGVDHGVEGRLRAAQRLGVGQGAARVHGAGGERGIAAGQPDRLGQVGVGQLAAQLGPDKVDLRGDKF